MVVGDGRPPTRGLRRFPKYRNAEIFLGSFGISGASGKIGRDREGHNEGSFWGPHLRRKGVLRSGDGWHVYLVECADGTLYCGITNDIAKRLTAHNAGKASRYTRARLPVRLVWSEPRATKSDALRRELAVKALPRAAKLRLTRQT